MGVPRWFRVWPTPEENPRHAGLELWMAIHGHQIVSRTASQFDWCQDKQGRLAGRTRAWIHRFRGPADVIILSVCTLSNGRIFAG
jgi:hypothetical protein